MRLIGLSALLLVSGTAYAAPVTFNVQVPSCTPRGDVFLRSNRLEPLIYLHDALTQTGPNTWSGTFEVSTGAAFNYKYTHTLCDAESCVGIEKSLTFVGDNGGEVPDRILQTNATETDDYVFIWRDALTDFDAIGQPIGARPDPERVAFCGPYLSVTGTSAVTVGYDSFGGEDVSIEWGPTTAYGSSLANAAQHRNFFELRDLLPGADYHYRINEGGTPGPDRTFRAPRAAGTPFRFAMLGDTQFYSLQQRLDHEAFVGRTRAFDPDLVLSVGDMVASEPGTGGPGGWMYPEMARWSLFFGAMKDLVAGAPFMVAMGNHEEDAPYFWDVFQFPETDAPALDHYDFKYGAVQFIALYTGTTDGYDVEGILDSQTAWLEQTLIRADADPEVRWKIVFMHRGPYHQGSNHPTDGYDIYDRPNGARPSWRSLMMQHGVDLYLAGHNHNFTYAYTDGIRFVTACSGAPVHSLRTPTESYTIHAERLCTANLFTVGERTLSFEAQRGDGTRIEEARFSLCKIASDCEEITSSCNGATAWSCTEGACAAQCMGGMDGGAGTDAAGIDASVDAATEIDAGADSGATTGRDGGAVQRDAGFFGIDDGMGCGCTAEGSAGQAPLGMASWILGSVGLMSALPEIRRSRRRTARWIASIWSVFSRWVN